MQQEQLTSWIEQATAGSLVALERVGYGASRATYLVDVAGEAGLVARVDTGDGPMAGTELSLGREAEVYRALAGTGVRIPLLRATSDDGTALLIERAAGTHEMTGLTDEQRHAVYDDYLAALAQLHVVDATTLDLPAFRQPSDGPANALEELDLWGRVLDEHTTQPWPLAHFTRAVLRRCAPQAVSRTVLCHGDVGPGNFMHDGNRVTAMLDWEFSHLGDPMDDLAWWVFRGHDMAGGCGDLAAQLAKWSATTGLPVNSDSIEYYRAFVMFRWLVAVASTLDNGGSGIDRSVHFALVPVLAVRLTRALATLLGVELADAPEPPSGAPTPAGAVIDALTSDLRDVVAPALEGSEARRRIAAAALYLAHLEAADRLGSTAWSEELADVTELTGRRPADIFTGRRQLADLVMRDDAPLEACIAYFWRDAHRQVALWPAVAARALAVPTTVPRIHQES